MIREGDDLLQAYSKAPDERPKVVRTAAVDVTRGAMNSIANDSILRNGEQ